MLALLEHTCAHNRAKRLAEAGEAQRRQSFVDLAYTLVIPAAAEMPVTYVCCLCELVTKLAP